MTSTASIVASMKRLRGRVTLGFALCLAGLVTGCGGVSGSHSVSPASLFLPGLMKHEAPAPVRPGESVRDLPAETDPNAGQVAG